VVSNNAWVRYVRTLVERDFPNLIVYGYKLTSPDTIDYNCIAWAAEYDQAWWWPDAQNEEYWPPDVPREETINAFRQAFQTLGYEVCEDDTLEPGFQVLLIDQNS